MTATSYRNTTAAASATFYYAVVANGSKSNEVIYETSRSVNPSLDARR